MPRWPARDNANVGSAARNNDNVGAGDQVAVSLRPSHRQGEIINIYSKQGYNHWKHATEKLEEEFYDCEPEGFYHFMKVLGSRADKCGWTEPNEILSISTDQGVLKKLITDYGSVDYDQVKTHELGFINENSRKAQDTAMLHDCIMNSLSKERKAKLNVNYDLYKF